MLKERVTEVLDLFAREELGNRLSQFAMMSLRGMILSEIDKYLVEQKAQVQKVAEEEVKK